MHVAYVLTPDARRSPWPLVAEVDALEAGGVRVTVFARAGAPAVEDAALVRLAAVGHAARPLADLAALRPTLQHVHDVDAADSDDTLPAAVPPSPAGLPFSLRSGYALLAADDAFAAAVQAFVAPRVPGAAASRVGPEALRDPEVLAAFFAGVRVVCAPVTAPLPAGTGAAPSRALVALVLHAAAAGVPIVTVGVGGLAAVVPRGVGGYVARPDHASPEQLAPPVVRLLADEVLWNRFSVPLRAHVAAAFPLAGRMAVLRARFAGASP